MKLADEIRAHIQRRYADPARRRGEESFSVVAADVHRDMKLASRMPAVCGALRSKALQSECGISLVEWSGPEQGSSAIAKFKLLGGPEETVLSADSPLAAIEVAAPATTDFSTSMDWHQFQEFARKLMARHFGTELLERAIPGVPKKFDMVSSDGAIVGDAKYLSLVGGVRTPSAKFMEIAGHVWLLDKTGAKRIFLVLGNQREVAASWLKKYGSIAGRIELYFLTADGTLERLH